MHRYLLAAVAIAAVASPAAARDGSGYIGIEGGVLFPSDQDGDLSASFTQSAQTPAAGTPAVAPGTGLVGAAPVAPGAFDGDLDFDYKTGWDIDAIAGYDFGMFRIEGEIGYKRAKFDNVELDETFIGDLETALNPGTGTAFVLDDEDFDLNDRVSVLSGMINGLIDFGNDDGLNFYAGVGFGRARVKMFGESDSAWAWQGIAGARMAISSNIDIGLKYRYFRTGNLDILPGDASFVSATRTVAVPNVPNTTPDPDVPGTGTTNVTFTRTALVTGDFSDRFSSHSLLASLIFNFGAAEEVAPPPPPPPPPPPAPPPPATQTCPDGSVILATEVCPAPPPPPPPPPPAPERG